MLLRVVLIVGIVGYVIARQMIGEPLRGRRVVILPVVLAIIGVVDLSHSGHQLRAVDIGCLAIGAILAAGIGLAQGTVLRIEARNGYVWGQMPKAGLLLWLGLVASRVAMTVLAVGLHAHVASSSATILLMLGINRLSQAAVVVVRAMSTGVPFAPDKNGRSLLTNLTGSAPAPTTGPVPPATGPILPTTGPVPPTDYWAPPAASQPGPQQPVPTLDWSAVRRQVTGYLNGRRR